MKQILSIALCFLLLTAPILALAQTSNPCTLQGANSSGNGAASQLPRCINQIYVWSLGVAALLALLMMIIGGYYYMTSSGNAERASTGTEMIWSSIIGLALLFGAYLILNTINPDLVNFNLTKGVCVDVAGNTTGATDASQCTGTNKWYQVFDTPTAPRTP